MSSSGMSTGRGFTYQYGTTSGTGTSFYIGQGIEDISKNMRSESWEEIIARQRNYTSALDQFEAYRKWRALQTPEEKLGPLEEEDVARGLINKWLVGCDPEFVVMDNLNRVVTVDGIIPHDGIVGWDHSGDVIEIRPEPAHGTYKLLQRLQKEILSNQELKQLEAYRWRAGAYIRARVTGRGAERILTLGGHVHIDQPPKARGEENEDHEHRIRALDRVTEWLEGFDVLPQAECAMRRNDPTAVRNHYGQFGDWRPAGGDGGSRPRMEYRTMCSWLYEPKAAYLALTSAKLAAYAPEVVLESLKKHRHSWQGFAGWLDYFRTKDLNARRALEKLFDGVERPFKVDPSVNFRENWRTLGV